MRTRASWRRRGVYLRPVVEAALQACVGLQAGSGGLIVATPMGIVQPVEKPARYLMTFAMTG
jgi:hypothetical protein